MKLEIYYEDGTVEVYDTSCLTASAPAGGGVCMVEAVPAYYEEEAQAPYGEGTRLDAGLWIHFYQFDALRKTGEGAARGELMCRVAVADGERMRGALLVARDGESWLARDWRTGALVDLSRLNAFGRAFVYGWGGAGVYADIYDARSLIERVLRTEAVETDEAIAEVLGVPASLVADATRATAEPSRRRGAEGDTNGGE